MKHYNPTINKSMADTFNLKGESTSDLLDSIVPVVLVNPTQLVAFSNGANNTASTSIMSSTTNTANKDFYLTNATLSFLADAGNTATNVVLNVTIDGVSRAIIRLSKLTTTASAQSLAVSFPIPLKIDRGTSILAVASVGDANIRVDSSVVGFFVENTKNT